VTRRGVRFGVFAKLTLLMGGLAAFSTILALVIQDRTLSADLREAASVRLARAAAAAERMIADHLAGVVQRYVAISTTPEFRANLEAGDRPTLAYHAQSLVERLGASTIAFQSPEGQLEALRTANLALWRRTPAAERSRYGIHAERGPESYELTFRLIAGRRAVAAAPPGFREPAPPADRAPSPAASARGWSDACRAASGATCRLDRRTRPPRQ